jgi:hypothetical protein
METGNTDKLAVTRPVSEKTCVLYDARDGRIIHTHHLVVMPGGREMTDEEFVRRAKEGAKQAGHSVDELSVLRFTGIDPNNIADYQIDLAEKKVVKR